MSCCSLGKKEGKKGKKERKGKKEKKEKAVILSKQHN